MDTSLKPSAVSESTLIFAVLASFLAHILFAVVIPAFKFDTPKKNIPIELTIELVKPKPPEPVVLPEPEPAKPEPIKPEPIKPEPIKKPEPKKIIEPKAAEPISEPITETKPPPEPPKVIALEPKLDAPPAAVVVPPQPPEPPKKSEPSDGDFDAYKNSVQRELKRNIRYPKMAEQRGITGVAQVEIKLDNDGNVVSVTILESTGSDALDEAAISTVKRSNLKQFMKDNLLGKLNSITVPIAFILADS